MGAAPKVYNKKLVKRTHLVRQHTLQTNHTAPQMVAEKGFQQKLKLQPSCKQMKLLQVQLKVLHNKWICTSFFKDLYVCMSSKKVHTSRRQATADCRKAGLFLGHNSATYTQNQ